jgi:hypothetical protein
MMDNAEQDREGLERLAYLLRRAWDEGGATGAECYTMLEDADAALAERDRLMDALEIAWGVIATVNSGRWDRQSPEWRDAAHRWRDEHWHRALAPEPPRGEERDG